MLPESKMTFQELTDWYLGLSSVKGLASFRNVRIYLNNFNKVYGDKIVGTIKPMDLEEYQTKRKIKDIFHKSEISFRQNRMKLSDGIRR